MEDLTQYSNMETSSERMYGDIEKEERYKKLQRILKMILLKQSEKLEKHRVDSVDYDMWLSSINCDPIDTSCAGLSVRSYKLGSEVIASSSNIKNLRQKRLKNYYSSPTTSSVEKISLDTIGADERILMPPPRSVDILAHSSRKNSPAESKNIRSSIQLNSVDTEHKMFKKKQQHLEKIELKTENTKTHNKFTSNLKPDRIFSKWRVSLDTKGQLIIKGTLECGKIARSKAVVQRLTSSTVRSVFKCIYQLEGIIYDEQNELPDFIRGKFYNGFPDDWENVHQVWKNFAASGYHVTFRWPTPITDSDDDITSEITDVTQNQFKKFHKNIQQKVFYNENKDLSIPESISDRSKSVKQTSDPQNGLINPSECCHCCFSKSICTRELPSSVESIKSSRILVGNDKQDINNTIDNFMEKIKQSESSDTISLNTPNKTKTSLTDIIREDAFTKIFENLSRKNCSIEYIEKVIQIFDALKFFVSYQPENENMNLKLDKPIDHNPEVSDKKITEPEKIEDSSFNGINVNGIHYTGESPSVSRKLMRYDNDNSNLTQHDSSDDGQRKKSLDELLRSREKLLRQRKHSLPQRIPSRKNAHNHQRIHIRENFCSSDKNKFILHQDSSVPVKNNKHIDSNKLVGSNNKKFFQYSISDVSITEDETKSQRVGYNLRDKNFLNKKIPASKREVLENQSRKIEYLNSYMGKNCELNTSFVDQKFRNNYRDNVNNIKKDKYHTENIKPTKNNFSEKFTNQIKLVNQGPDISHNDKENLVESFFDNDELEAINKIKETHSKSLSSGKKTTRKSVVLDIQDGPVNLNISRHLKLPVIITDELISDNTLQNSSLLKNPISSTKENNLKIKLQDVKSAMRNKDLKNDQEKNISNHDRKLVGNEIFGSQSHPKKLINWIPKLQKKPKGNYGLHFEGKLLNEADHIVNRKFSTDLVVKRVNRRIIRTVDNNFYELIGDLCDTNHCIPKTIQKYCLNGCPSNISQFCEKWTMFEQEIMNNSSADISSMQKSSSGRRIFPPLNYWNGQKTSLIDDQLVYSPGQSHESSFDISRKEISQNSSKPTDTSSSFASQKIINSVVNKKLTKLSEKNSKKIDSSLEPKITTEKKEKNSKQIKSNLECKEAKKVSQIVEKTKLTKRHACDSKSNDVDSSEDVNYICSKRKKLISRKQFEEARNTSIDVLKGSNSNKQKFKMTYSFQKSVPYQDDELSDDEVSMI